MPSCPSQLSVLREKEINSAANKFVSDSHAIWQYLNCVAPYGYTRCHLHLKDSCWCLQKNIISGKDTRQKCQLLDNFISCDAILNTNYIIIPCEALKVQNISSQKVIQNIVKFHSHDVISIITFCIHFQISTYFIFLNTLIALIQKAVSMHKIDCVSNGIKIDSVMEVDEPVNRVISYENFQIGGKLEELESLMTPLNNDKPDGVHSHVINNDEHQVMNGSEYLYCKNSVVSNIDVEIKEEKKEDKSELEIEKKSLLNGNANINFQVNYKNAKYNKLVNCEPVLDDNKKLIPEKSNEKDKVQVNFIKTEPGDGGNDNVKNQEIKINEKSKSQAKSVESSSERDKICDNDQYANSVNHISSSSSTSSLSSISSSSKKHLSQSHQPAVSLSVSSSRHKHRDDKYHKTSSPSHNKNNEVSSSCSRKEDTKSKSDSRSKSRSCHHKPEDKCHCKSHHQSSSHRHSSSSKKQKKVQSVRTQCTADEISYELNHSKIDPTNPYFTRVPWVPHPQITGMKYGRYYRIEEDRNGGATVCHLYMDEINHLPEAQLNECAIEFIKLSYSEDENECAYHVMGIVHGAASYLPDLVDYMADHYPSLIVKTGSLASRDNHTTTMSQYRDEVYKTYSNGTFRYAPLDQLSICGVLGEEVGAYFPDFVARLEQSPFMKPVMPWSFMSVVQTDNPRESNDGPIFWVRPGEQMLPANEALKESSRPKKRRNNELDNLAYIGGSRFSEARESLFMDRTKAHADQVGVDYGITNTAPTAAVGVLKAVNCGHPEHGNRATKDVVAFHAQDYNELLEILMLDLYEPPQTQCTKWIEVSKLNTLRREGIRYAHLQLHDNDVYYLPRKIIHQFQTISSVASVAWHIRYRDYFKLHGAPNLHTPTGINKGQVFYEKKNVAVYCPPIHENDLLAAVTGLDGGLKTPKKSERLREYSPFKHSPRKLHKYQSPKAASKKEKQSETVSTSNHCGSKHELASFVNDQKKSNGTTTKKRERLDSVEDAKEEHEQESPRVTEKRTENSHCRHPEEVRTLLKDKNRESHSSHRKEVKNLEAEFDSKRDKPSKPKHEKSSKESRHEKSSISNGGSSSSSSSKPKKSKEHESSFSNSQCSHKVKSEKDNKSISGKRRHGHSPHHSPSKKPREGRDSETRRKTPPKNPVEKTSENETFEKVKSNTADINPIGRERLPSPEREQIGKNASNKLPEPSELDKKESSKSNIVKEASNSCSALDIDLKSNPPYAGFIGHVPPFPPPPLPPPPPPPPPPADSPPIYPPLPPSSPKSPERPPANASNSPQKSQPQPQPATESTCLSSTDAVLGKKAKKKVAKTDGYDLLGEIMSKMDRKKL